MSWDRLEKLGLIERRASPDDRRSLLVVLTAQGRKVIDEAVIAHVANETRLVADISAADRKQLDRILRQLLRSLDAASSALPPGDAPVGARRVVKRTRICRRRSPLRPVVGAAAPR